MNLALSETPKTGFLTTRPICSPSLVSYPYHITFIQNVYIYKIIFSNLITSYSLCMSLILIPIIHLFTHFLSFIPVIPYLVIYPPIIIQVCHVSMIYLLAISFFTNLLSATLFTHHIFLSHMSFIHQLSFRHVTYAAHILHLDKLMRFW